MSFRDKLRTWWLFKQSSRGGAKRVYIVDVAPLCSSNGNRGRIPPRTQLDTLRRLGRFAGKENIQIYAVFEGSPLRKAPDGGTFDGVVVRYAGKSSQVPDLVVNLMKDAARRKEVTVITSDRRLEERVLVNGGAAMRASTFSKAMDATVGGSGERPRDSRRRPSRRRRGGGGGGDRKPAATKPQDQGGKEPDPVRDMIDLVE